MRAGGEAPTPYASPSYMLTTLSAATVRLAKSTGVVNLAFLPCKSASETPRA